MAALIKIAIVGPESTGKSTLAKQLADHYQTVFVPEFAREYLEKNGSNYSFENVEHIAQEQIKLEDKCASKAIRILICDTNLIVIKIWMKHAFGVCPEWIHKEINKRKYHLHLLTNIDVPWESDPIREHPHLRKEIFERYKSELEQLKIPYKIISGNFDQRLISAIVAIDEIP